MAIIKVIADGPRNYVVAFFGTVVETIKIADVSALTPPCRSLNLRKFTYDVSPGDFIEILWEAVPNISVTKMTEGNGQTVDMTDAGGVANSMDFPGVTGDVLVTLSTTGSPKAVAGILYFTKKY